LALFASLYEAVRSTKHNKEHTIHFKALSHKIPATFSKVGNSQIFTSRLNIAIALFFPITPRSFQALTAVVAQMIVFLPIPSIPTGPVYEIYPLFPFRTSDWPNRCKLAI